MAIDLFNTRVLLRAVEQMKPARSFLRDTFFSATELSTTAYVDIDVVKGARRLAPFVSPTHQAKFVERIGYTTNSYRPPYIKQKMVTTAQEFLDRSAGANVYAGGQTPQQKAEEQLGKDMAELEDMITRREEWMCAQLLKTGQVSIVGEGVSETINFGMAGTHIVTLTTTDLWSDKTNSDPLGDLRTWRRLIQKDSGLTPDVVVMGSDALDAFLAHTGVINQLDTRRIDLGMIEPTAFGNGAIYYGRIRDVGVDLWVYDEWYIDPTTGVETPMVDVGKVLMGSTRARSVRHYGAIQDLEFGGLVSVPRFPKSWIEEDPSCRILSMQSAPLMSLHQVDAFVAAAVL